MLRVLVRLRILYYEGQQVLNELAVRFGAMCCRHLIVWQNQGMLVSAAPCALLWPAAMIVWGPGFMASKHKHHCVQLVMALQGSLRVRSGPGRKWMKCGAALVRPDAPHEVDASDDIHVLLAFVDAESDLGAALLENIPSEISIVHDRTILRWRRHLGNPAKLNAARVEPWVRGQLLSGRRTPKIHPGVRRVLRTVREEIGTRHKFSLEHLAGIAGLSPSRFMHVFTESVGVPLRPFILWLRLQRACGEMMRGTSITDAAHRSGFSDAAHLTRTLRRMLGMTPGELISRRLHVRAMFPS
jgi:AraC-like DNA-binding protein